MKYLTFTREMARAYAEGRKRMTRRVMKQQPNKNLLPDEFIPPLCPYGNPGDQIILGTTWAVWEEFDHLKPTQLLDESDCVNFPIWSYFDSDEKPEGFGKLRPGRFLPGFLRGRMPCVTLKTVRAELVQDITIEDIVKEGLVSYLREHDACCELEEKWIKLWNSINANRGYSWDSNPWIWVLEW